VVDLGRLRSHANGKARGVRCVQERGYGVQVSVEQVVRGRRVVACRAEEEVVTPLRILLDAILPGRKAHPDNLLVEIHAIRVGARDPHGARSIASARSVCLPGSRPTGCGTGLCMVFATSPKLGIVPTLPASARSRSATC